MGKLDGFFGMCEMEITALQIIELALDKGSWNVELTYDQADNKNGFLALICHGWLVYNPVFKSAYRPTLDFTLRVKHCLERPTREDTGFRDKVLALRFDPNDTNFFGDHK